MIGRRLAIVLSMAAGLVVSAAPAVSAKIVTVPEGNRNVSQPRVPGASVKRTRQTKTTFDRKYEKIRDLLKQDAKLRSKISKAAAKYGIDPLHIAGALVGEHTYNVDAYDRLQSYYIKAMAYASGGISFSYGGEDIDSFIKRDEFERCTSLSDSFDLWTCREQVWEKTFRGKRVNGRKYPNDRFSAVFFQPFYAGQTFGLGQLNPLTALKHTDKVNRISGHRKRRVGTMDCSIAPLTEPDMRTTHPALWIGPSKCQLKLGRYLRGVKFPPIGFSARPVVL